MESICSNYIDFSRIISFNNGDEIIDYLCPFNLSRLQILDVLVRVKSVVACYAIFKIFTQESVREKLSLNDEKLSGAEKKVLHRITNMEYGGIMHAILLRAAHDKVNRFIRYGSKRMDYCVIDQSTFFDIFHTEIERIKKKRTSLELTYTKKRKSDEFGRDSIADVYDYGLSDW